MLDIQQLRTDPENIASRLAKRGYTFPVAQFQWLEAQRKSIQTQTQELQARRNATSKQIGIAKQKGEDAAAIMAEIAHLGDELKQAESQLECIQAELQQLLLTIPNLAHSSVPEGKSETDNLEIRRWERSDHSISPLRTMSA